MKQLERGTESSLFEENLALCIERFPQLAFQIPQIQPKAPAANSWRPNVRLEKVELLYILGLEHASSYQHLKSWLKKGNQLVFLEEDFEGIAQFLHREDAGEILQDPQVHLRYFPKGTERKQVLQELVDQFPNEKVEVASSRNTNALRLKILRKTTLAYSLHIDRLYGYQPFENFAKNMRQISRSFYANRLKGAFTNVPAVICGAGPSLQKSMDVLKSLEDKALIIAGGSTLAALSSKGVLPHFGMAIDPNLEEYRRFRYSFSQEMPLLYSTRVHPDIFNTFNGTLGYLRSGVGGVPELWMEEELGLSDPLIGNDLSGETLSVTGICVAWAEYLGCNPILLNGVDLAYVGKKRYAEGVTHEPDTALDVLDQKCEASDRILKRKNQSGEPIYTAVRWVMESASLAHFAKKNKHIQFFNTSEEGLCIQGIEYRALSAFADAFQTADLRALVHERVQEAMFSRELIETSQERMDELKSSLERVIEHLRMIKENDPRAVLSEMELQDETAFLYLFYDMRKVLDVALRKQPERFWEKFYEIAKKYRAVIR